MILQPTHLVGKNNKRGYKAIDTFIECLTQRATDILSTYSQLLQLPDCSMVVEWNIYIYMYIYVCVNIYMYSMYII